MSSPSDESPPSQSTEAEEEGGSILYARADLSDDELIQHCKQFIRCDTCQKENATMRCSRCHHNHYCSRECQVKDWKKEHKSVCVAVAVLQQEAEDQRVQSQGTMAQLEATETMRRQVLEADPKCSICFEKPMVQPIVLEKCHHAFCFHCLQDWNRVQQTQSEDMDFIPTIMTCPLCRQEIPNIVETINADIVLLFSSAYEGNASESFVLEQCTKAQAKMDLLKEIEQAEKNPMIAERYRHQLLIFQLRLHSLKKEHDKALLLAKVEEERLKFAVENGLAMKICLNKLQSNQLNSKRKQELTQEFQERFAKPNALPKHHIEMMLKVAQIQVLQEDWTGARASFLRILGRYSDNARASAALDILPHWETCSGLSRCLYKLGEYDRAIDLGQIALGVDRHLQDSHKYLTLSYLAIPSMQREAQRCAAEAVIYESPWDKEHRAVTMDVYRRHFSK